MTEIIDKLTYADGRPVNGRVVVSWPPFQVGGNTIAGGMQPWDIIDGDLHVTLYANVNARPIGMYYTATYELEEGALYTEYWIVPNLPEVTLGQCRIGFPITPSAIISALQLTSAGAEYGMFLGWDGTHWVPMYTSSINVFPKSIGLNLTALAAPDLSVAGSPADLGGVMTLNVPSASATARGVVTIAAQSFAGEKTFLATAHFNNGITVTGPSTIAGYVPDSRRVDTGYGLSGGGDLTANRTIVAVDGSTIQKIRTFQNTTLIGTRPALNFVAGPNIQLTILDDPAGNWVGVTIAGTVPPPVGADVPFGTGTGQILVWQATPTPGAWTLVSKGTPGQVLVAGTTTVGWGTITGYVQDTRRIDTGYGLAGGGDLSANRTLVAVDNTTVQKIQVRQNTTLAGTRHAINFIAGPNVSLSIADNPASDWVDVEIESSGGGSGPVLPAGTASGDILVWQNLPAPGFWAIVPKGSTGQVLTSGAVTVAWQSPTPVVLDFSQDGGKVATLSGPAYNMDYRAGNGVAVSVAQVDPQHVSLTFSQVPATVNQLVQVANAGALIGTRPQINFIASTGVSISVTDDAPFGRVNVTIASTGGGGTTVPGGTAPADILVWQNTPAPGFWTILPKGSAGTVLTAGASSLNWSAPPVTSVFGRTGAVVAQVGDYAAAQVTNAVSTIGSYADPPWIASIAWSKVTGVPASFGQTPWTQDIEGSGFKLMNTGNVGIGNDASVLPHASVPWKFLIVGETATASNHCGTITACGNSTIAVNMGALSFANYAITATEKRIGQILGITDGAIDSGALVFFAANAGALTERMRITAAGNVGIGTANPGAPLDVNAAILAQGTYQSQWWSTGNVDYRLKLQMVYDVNGIRPSFINRAGGTDYNVLTFNSGNVGIGTTNPAAKFNVCADATPITSAAMGLCQVAITGVTDNRKNLWLGFDTTANVGVVQAGISFVGWNALLLNPSGGSVGIGTTTPLNPLQVHGATDQNLGIASQGGRIRIGAFNDAGSNVVPLGFDGARFDFSGGPVCIGTNTAPSGAPLTFGTGLGNKIAIWDGGAGGIYGLGLQSGVMQVICNSSNDRVAFGYGNSTAFTELACVKPNGIGVGTTNVVDCVTIANLGAYGQLRMVMGNYGTFFRNDGATFYLMVTNSGAPYGTWKAPFPLSVDLASCNCTLGNNVTIAGSLQVGPGPVSQAGDIAVGRPASPTTGAIFFGNSASRYIYWDGTQFIMTGPINSTSGFTVNGVPVGGGIDGMRVQINGSAPAGPYTYFDFRNNSFCLWSLASAGPGNNTAQISAFAASDARLKRNVIALTGGLPIIDQLRPIEAEWNGLAGQTEGRRVVSVIAQELQKVIPGAVDTFRAKLHPDDADETELLHINPTELTMHLILAVQQLSRRIEELEGRMN